MKILLLSLFAAFALALSLVAEDQPLTVQQDGNPAAVSTLMRLNRYQADLKDNMAQTMRQAQKNNASLPLGLLITLAALYGVVHSLGPGHGKFVSASYAMSQKISVLRGGAYGFGVGLFHGLAGVVLVLFLALFLKDGMLATGDRAYHHAQSASYVLIVILGLYLIAKGVLLLRRKPDQAATPAAPGNGWGKALPPVIALGLVPCPGVVLIMLFCLSLGMLGIGILLALAFSFGMAATLAAINVVAVLGKQLTVSTLARRRIELAESIFALAAGLAVTVFGLVILL